jgi:hypothetical protein
MPIFPKEVSTMSISFEHEVTQRNGDSCECPLLESLATKIRQELDDSSFPKWEQAAGPLKVDVSTLSKWTARSKPAPIPAYRLVRWTKVMGPGLLRWICRMCGYELIPIHEHLDCPEPIPLIALFSAKAGAAVGETLADIASDGQWDDSERRTDLVSWLKVQTLVDGIVRGIQATLAKAS